MNWIVQGCRPDLAFEAVDLSTKFQTGIIGDLTRAVKLVLKLKGEAAFVVFPCINDISKWQSFIQMLLMPISAMDSAAWECMWYF